MFIPQKLSKHAYTDSITNIVFFIVCKIFSFGVLEAFDSKGIINKLKRYYVSHGMRWRCKFHFYVRDNILFTFASLFRQERVPQVFRVFFAVLDKRTEWSSSFIEASLEIGRKMKSLQAKQRTRWNMQGLRHW